MACCWTARCRASRPGSSRTASAGCDPCPRQTGTIRRMCRTGCTSGVARARRPRWRPPRGSRDRGDRRHRDEAGRSRHDRRAAGAGPLRTSRARRPPPIERAIAASSPGQLRAISARSKTRTGDALGHGRHTVVNAGRWSDRSGKSPLRPDRLARRPAGWHRLERRSLRSATLLRQTIDAGRDGCQCHIGPAGGPVGPLRPCAGPVGRRRRRQPPVSRRWRRHPGTTRLPAMRSRRRALRPSSPKHPGSGPGGSAVARLPRRTCGRMTGAAAGRPC